MLAGGGAMAPASGGSPYTRFDEKQRSIMDMKLKAHSGVGPILTQSKQKRFLVVGDQGPLFLPMVCCEGASQTAWKGFSQIDCCSIERACKVLLTKHQKQRVFQAECRQLWLLHAHSLQCPVSSFWMESCLFGLPEVALEEWTESYKAHHNSEQRPEVDSSHVSSFVATQAGEEGVFFPKPSVGDFSLSSSLLGFGLPHEHQDGADGPCRPDSHQGDLSVALSPLLQMFGVPRSHATAESINLNRTQLAELLDQFGLPSPEPQACRRVPSSTSQASCGDVMTPYIYAALASVQSCFAFLKGVRVGEASNPGPGQVDGTSVRQIKHDPHTGVRIGEAQNPGPSPFGPELESMIKQYVMEAVREAIKEAFKNLGLSAPADSVPTTNATQGSLQSSEPAGNKHDKGSPKGKGKLPKQPPKGNDKGKGQETSAPKLGVSTRTNSPPNPPAGTTPHKRGKGKGQATESEWKLVTRQPKSGDFQLRAQDWNAPVIHFSKLSAAIDAHKPDAVLEGVILAEKQEIDQAKLMLLGSKAQYKFLLIYLAKEEKSQKIPGRVQDQLCFRDAIVLQCHSSTVVNSPTPAGLASAPIKVAPLQSVAVYVRVPRQYASEQLWTSFCKNASKMAAAWAADRHVQILDSFNWAEEKQRTGGRELQVLGILRVPKKDMSTLLAVSGQLGVFIEPCRSQAPRMKISWIEKVRSETDSQYLTRANQHGADFGLAVHGGRLGWRLAAQPDELLPRVWTLPWLPMHWDDDAVKQLLASEFKDIDLLTHRRQRGNLSYRFRATCLKGDKDLVALLAETDTGPLTLWASVAPARTLQKSQRRLPQGTVPVVAPKQRSTAFPTTSRALTETEVDADGKPMPGAKRTKCDVRTVPNELKTIDIDKDGNCVYRAVSEGLAWLSGGKIKVEHRELRAKAITHLRKHQEAYSAQWDKESPTGAPMQSFEDYLVASAQNGAYGSPLEVEALARIYDVQIILIPLLADFAVMSFRTSQAKRVIVLWYHDKHIDLLVPKDDVRKYPQAVLNITTGPVHKLRAGGARSTCSRASKAGSEWTVGARSSISLDKPLDKASVWSRAPSDASIRKNPLVSQGRAKSVCSKSSGSLLVSTSRSVGAGGFKGKVVFSGRSNRRGDALPASSPPTPRVSQHSQVEAEAPVPKVGAKASGKRKLTRTESDASQDLSGCVAEPPVKRKYSAAECRHEGDSFPVRCPLCPFRTSVRTFKLVRQYLRDHYAKHHRDAELPEPAPRKKVSYLDLIRVQDGKAQVHWQCPLCPMAMLKEDAEKMCEPSIAKHTAQHKRKHHPKTRWTAWRRLDYEARAAKLVRTKMCARISNSFGEIAEMLTLGFTFLWWPRAKGYCKNLKQQSRFIARMRPTWVCKHCGNTFLCKKEAVTHAKRICPFLHPTSALSITSCRRLLRRRVRVLAKLRDKYCASAPSSERREADLLLFDKALEHFGAFHF